MIKKLIVLWYVPQDGNTGNKPTILSWRGALQEAACANSRESVWSVHIYLGFGGTENVISAGKGSVSAPQCDPLRLYVNGVSVIRH